MIEEDSPNKEPMSPSKRFGWDTKDRRSWPLKTRRWLRANVGRPWNDVYSELCSKFPSKNDRDCVIRDIGYIVEQDIYKEDGKFYNSKGYQIHNSFIVYDGLLLEIKKETRKYRRQSQEEQRARYNVYWKNSMFIAKVNDIWYELIVLEKPKLNPKIYDAFLKTQYVDERLQALFYGSSQYYCDKLRQLNKTEIKRLELK